MNAPAAAIIGALIGMLSTLVGVFVNTHFTARHSRRIKVMEMCRDAYLSAICSLEKLSEAYSLAELERAARAMHVASAHLLFADHKVSEAFEATKECVVELRRSLAGHEEESVQQRLTYPAIKKAMMSFNEQTATFIEVAREHIGVR